VGVYTPYSCSGFWRAASRADRGSQPPSSAPQGVRLGLLTLRMPGNLSFSIATIALTLSNRDCDNELAIWSRRGPAFTSKRPAVDEEPFSANYVQMLFFVQALLVVLSVCDLSIQSKSLICGRGLPALKGRRTPAESRACRPLRLKAAGVRHILRADVPQPRPQPRCTQYADPSSAFNQSLNYSVRLGLVGLANWSLSGGTPRIGRARSSGPIPVEHDATIADRAPSRSEVNVRLLG